MLIIETTRGDSPLPEGFTRAAEEQRFAEAIERAFARGGCVLIPVFALGKTQEVLAMLYKFKRAKMIARRSDLHRRAELEDDGDLRSPRATTSPRVLPRLQLFPEVAAVRPQRQNDRRRAGAAGPHLRALQRDDDAENALEYFRAPGDRASGALDLFCRLCRSGIARRDSARGAA